MMLQPGMPLMTTLGRLRQEDQEFKFSLGYVVRPCPQKQHWKFNKLAVIVVKAITHWGFAHITQSKADLSLHCHQSEVIEQHPQKSSWY